MKKKNTNKLIGVGITLVIGIVIASLVSQPTEEEFEKLVEFESTGISPTPDLFDNSAKITEGQDATITVDVKSVSENYQHDAIVVTSFIHTEANSYMKINDPEIKVGTLSRFGATSGPLFYAT